MLYHHLAALVGVLIGGRISDALVARRRQFRMELQCASILLGVPMILWMGFAGSLAATWAAMAGMGLCRGLSYGFASLSAAYLIGGLAVLIAVTTTFRRDLREDCI